MGIKTRRDFYGMDCNIDTKHHREVLLVDDIGDIRQLVEVVTYQVERFKTLAQI